MCVECYMTRQSGGLSGPWGPLWSRCQSVMCVWTARRQPRTLLRYFQNTQQSHCHTVSLPVRPLSPLSTFLDLDGKWHWMSCDIEMMSHSDKNKVNQWMFLSLITDSRRKINDQIQDVLEKFFRVLQSVLSLAVPFSWHLFSVLCLAKPSHFMKGFVDFVYSNEVQIQLNMTCYWVVMKYYYIFIIAILIINVTQFEESCKFLVWNS